ncbi:O-antigen ligase family protein [Agromyces atrinae]|uniref:O-antigen ligase n=1 Tax=Agromyces atrinae TaxID=592376 RepID=A0A4Q2M5Z1_9MICO|nr:O-antigen ligase family protein [Agromyces atrinae]NYD66673.1 O-antigen ligase [Agromyces atrinae]RXZ87338.1 O-antigen ligase family protein [Agromyces atrinae]
MTPAHRRLAVRAFSVLLFFTVLAGQFWRNLLGWWGFGVIAGLLTIGAVVLLVREKPEWSWRRSPKGVAAFLIVAALSIAWSHYPAASALGVGLTVATTIAAVFVGLCLSWAEFLRALGNALRWILGLSLLFELGVALVVRGPLLPNFVSYEGEKIPMAFYWSRGLLFDGGPIEGIVASRNLLGFIALLALIVFGIQLAAKTVQRRWGITWLVIAAVSFVLTRSATVTLAAVVVLAALGFALWARHRGPRRRGVVYLTAGAALVASIAALTLGWNLLLSIFGKSDDLTGRFDIWAAVSGLASERPLAGWGWIGYWAPWVDPFDSLAERKGVLYLQAHNAWLDVWFQLGIIGLVVFAAIVIPALWRSWFLAVDTAYDGRGAALPPRASALLPLLVLAALIAQSLAESRILVEGGWVLLVAVAFLTKRRQLSGEAMP